jgi:hypothetical protein
LSKPDALISSGVRSLVSWWIIEPTISRCASSSVPTEAAEMFQIKPYADKPSVFVLSVHSFVSYERIGKWNEERYGKGGRKPYFIELGGTPRWINLYTVADADVYYNYEA